MINCCLITVFNPENQSDNGSLTVGSLNDRMNDQTITQENRERTKENLIETELSRFATDLSLKALDRTVDKFHAQPD